jgi:hypothetical protein
MHSRAAVAVALAALVFLNPASGNSALAGTTTALPGDAPPTDAATAAPKVVIVVGPMEGNTANNRARGDAITGEVLKWRPDATVVKVYSPDATWSKVKAAAQGASVLVYMGHGNGWPSPYTSTLMGDRQDGMGLNAKNASGGYDDYTKKYYGEDCIDGAKPDPSRCPSNGTGIRLAPNAIVILNNLCYAPGAGEPGMADPSVAVAKQRVDNFASGFIRAGARAVLADDYSSAQTMVRLILTTHQPILDAWRSSTFPGYHGNFIAWTPTRNPAFTSTMDPQTWTTGFSRAITADPALTTDDVLAGAGLAGTASNPSTLTAPGAASVASATLPVFTDQSLATASGATLAAATAVRVDDLVVAPATGDSPAPPPAVEVHTFDGAVAGWVSGDGLAPRDSTSPVLWSTTGPTTISPNFDGNLDRLSLWHRLSEVASWTAKVLDPDGAVIRSQSGTSDLVDQSWDGLVGGNPAPAGSYRWTLHAADAWGNPALDAGGDVTVVDEPFPSTAVLAFKALSGPYTNATTLAYELDFASAVTGLAAGDVSRTGTATSCTVNSPTGGGAEWYVTVSGCSAGTVQLALKAGSVLDADLLAGPPVSTSAPSVLIDRTKPVAKAPTTTFRTGVQASTSALPVKVAWSATDGGGAGLATYDLARSVDGGAFKVIQSGLTSPSVTLSLAAGHTYRFEARARDRAGNVGGWAAGPTLRPQLVQQSSSAVTWSGSWATWTGTAFSGGSARTSTSAGARVTYAFSGRAVAVVMSRDPAYGQVKVYLDGTYLTTVDTGAASHTDRSVVYARAFAWGSHTLKLVVVGTSGRPRVVVDAFEVIG